MYDMTYRIRPKIQFIWTMNWFPIMNICWIFLDAIVLVRSMLKSQINKFSCVVIDIDIWMVSAWSKTLWNLLQLIWMRRKHASQTHSTVVGAWRKLRIRCGSLIREVTLKGLQAKRLEERDCRNLPAASCGKTIRYENSAICLCLNGFNFLFGPLDWCWVDTFIWLMEMSLNFPNTVNPLANAEDSNHWTHLYHNLKSLT